MCKEATWGWRSGRDWLSKDEKIWRSQEESLWWRWSKEKDRDVCLHWGFSGGRAPCALLFLWSPKGHCPVAVSDADSSWTGTTALQRAWLEKHASDQSIHSLLEGGEVGSGTWSCADVLIDKDSHCHKGYPQLSWWQVSVLYPKLLNFYLLTFFSPTLNKHNW